MNLASFLSESRTQAVSRVLLVILRVYIGIIFLVASWPKLTGEFAPRMTGVLQRSLEAGRPHGFYQGFLENVVLSNPGLFGGLITYGELLVGLALVLGVGTRLAAGVMMFVVLNYMSLKGAWFWHPSSNDAAFFMIGVVLIMGAAGRAYGVDYFLSRRWPRIPIW